MTAILVVGCPAHLVSRLKASLESPEIHLAFAPSLRAAYRDTAEYRPDFIVLDLEADLLEGFELVELLRGRQTASLRPLLIFRHRAEGAPSEEKPAIDLPVLRKKLYHVFGISKRLPPAPSSVEKYRDESLDADFGNAVFMVQGHRVTLSVREQELLRFLIERADRIALREEIIDGLWGYETRSLDVIVRRLRVKLGAAGHQIESVPGFGYRFLRSSSESRSSVDDESQTAGRLRGKRSSVVRK